MASGSFNIEIPHPVIEVEVDYEPAMSRSDTTRWFARIEIGGVVLMKREYLADWPFGERPDPGTFAEDADEARRMILKDFGRKMKELLEGDPK